MLVRQNEKISQTLASVHQIQVFAHAVVVHDRLTTVVPLAVAVEKQQD